MVSAYLALKAVAFTVSQIGGSLNDVQGDYICKRQNAEAKGSGHLKAGFRKKKTFSTGGLEEGILPLICKQVTEFRRVLFI